MRLTGLNFCGMVVALIGLIVSADPDVIANHQALNQAIFYLSSFGLVGVVFNQIWPRPLEVAVGLIRHRLPFRQDPPLIPLAQAARELYEANLDSGAGIASRRDDGAGSNPLRWWAYQLLVSGTELHGRRPPSTVLERIPSDLFNRLHFDDGVTKLSDGDGTDYVDLAMTREALQAALARYSDSKPSGRG